MASNISYSSTIKYGSLYMRFRATKEFVVDGVVFCGVIQLAGSGSSFDIEQKVVTGSPNFHLIKICNKYLSFVTAPWSSLPPDAQTILSSIRPTPAGNNVKFLSTSQSVNRTFLVSTTASSASASTVDLQTTTNNVFIGYNSNFWMKAGSFIASSVSRGTPWSFEVPSDANTSGGGGTVDPSGNPTLQRGDCVGFTATTAGPMLGAATTGTLVPSYARPCSFMVTAPGTPNIGRYLPANSILGTEMSQGTMKTPYPFSNAAFASATDAAVGFGKFVAISSDAQIIAAASDDFVRIYGLGVGVLPTLQTIPGLDVGTEIITAMRMSDDGSVVAFLETVPTGVRLRVWARAASNSSVWVEAAATMPIISVASADRMTMTSDGRIVAIGSDPSGKELYVVEDTSCDGLWGSADILDLTSSISGSLSGAMTVSSEGRWLYVQTELDSLELFRRDGYGVWTNTSAILTAYAGTSIVDMVTSFNGVFLSVIDDTAGIINFIKFTESLIAQNTVDALALAPGAQITSNTTGTAIVITNNTDTVLNGMTRGDGVFSRLVSSTFATLSIIRSVAFTDSNLATAMVVGDVSTNTIAVTNSISNAKTYITGRDVVIGTQADGSDDKLLIDTTGIYLSDDLFLEGKTTDPLTATTIVTGALCNLIGSTSPATAPLFSERFVEANRVADTVTLYCRFIFTAFTGATGDLQITMATAFPTPKIGFIPAGVVTFGATTGAANPFVMTTGGPPNGVNIVARLTSTTLIEFFEDRSDGSTIPVDASSVAANPHVNAAGDFTFVITYFTTTT